MVQWLRLHLPMQGVWVQSLVGVLRSHMALRQNMKQKQYCNKFNKDFKNGPHPKKKKNVAMNTFAIRAFPIFFCLFIQIGSKY